MELSTQQFGVYSQSSRQYKFGRVPFGPRPEATTKDPRPSLHTPELRVPILDGINEIPHTSPRQTTTLPAANPRYFNHNHSPQNSPYRPASPRHSPLHSPRHSPRLNNSPRGEHSPHNKNKAPKSPRLNSSPRHPLPTPESTKKSTPPSETTPIRRSKTEGYKDRPLRSSANDHQIKRPKSSKSQKLTTQETTQINNHVREPLPAKPRVRSQPRESREPREPRQHTPEPAAHADFIKESSKHKKRDSNDFITETKPRGSAEIKKESKHKHNSENNTPSKTQQETESQPRPKSPPRLRTHHHNNNHEAEQTKRVTSRHHDTPRTEAPRIDGPRKIKSQASIGPPKESNDELAKRHSIAIEKPKRDLANRKSRRPKSDMIPSTPTFDSTVDATPEPRALKHRGSPSTSRKPRNTSTPDIQPIEQPQKANKRDQS